MEGVEGGARAVERQLADAKERHAALAARWAEEKGALDRIGEITERIDQLRMEAERAERAGDLQRVAEIRYGSCRRSSASSPSARRRPSRW